jgi:hypothetical protein
MLSPIWDAPDAPDFRRQTYTRTIGERWKRLDGNADDDETLHHICHRNHEMRFRLVYDGPLSSGASGHKTQNKWLVRRNLQPQLEELWSFKPVLQGYASSYPMMPTPDKDDEDIEVDGAPANVRIARNFRRLRQPIVRGGHNYLPLVRADLFLTCTLDILFLRKDGPGETLTHAGDLDNRIKTLFDGLRMPEGNEPKPPDVVTDPFHCLVEDDRLITSFAIRTDRLLHRPNEPKDSVVLVIDVVVVPTRVKIETNSGFEWD